jgi:3-deoxy-manno-octulosonate cytidylyltransferase (CMP-KDO synthetase)
VDLFCIIPASSQSKRFPGKILHPIAGKPLLQRVVEGVAKSCIFDNVIVGCDDDETESLAKSLNCDVHKTDRQYRNGSERCADITKEWGLKGIVVDVQADNPFVDNALIRPVVDTVLDCRWVDVSTACYFSSDKEDFLNKNTVKAVVDKHSKALYFSREPIGWMGNFFRKHVGIYAYTSESLLKYLSYEIMALEYQEKLEQLRILENGGTIYTVDVAGPYPSIDSIGDVDVVEKYLEDMK